jgi:hypothetical protein
MGRFCNFLKTGQGKQSPNGRKCAQSGHPGARSLIKFVLTRRKDFPLPLKSYVERVKKSPGPR